MDKGPYGTQAFSRWAAGRLWQYSWQLQLLQECLWKWQRIPKQVSSSFTSCGGHWVQQIAPGLLASQDTVHQAFLEQQPSGFVWRYRWGHRPYVWLVTSNPNLGEAVPLVSWYWSQLGVPVYREGSAGKQRGHWLCARQDCCQYLLNFPETRETRLDVHFPD